MKTQNRRMVHLYSPPMLSDPAKASRTIGNLLRTGLAAVAALLVIAAFARVIFRAATAGNLKAGDIELTVMHWSGEGGQEEDKIVEDSLAESWRAGQAPESR